MHVLNTSIRCSLVLFKDRILGTLNAQYEKIALVVSAIFTAIGACFLLHYFSKSRNLKAKHVTSCSPIVVKNDQLPQINLKTNQTKDSSTVTKKVAPPTLSSQSTLQTQAPSFDIYDDHSDDIVNSDDDNEEEWSDRDVENADGFDVQDLKEEERESEFTRQLEMHNQSAGLENDSKIGSVGSQKKYFFDDKFVSLRTLKCLKFLRTQLNKLRKKYGKAVDNGDCFWDAFAQRLSIIERRSISIKELRQVVSDEIQRIERDQAEENWIKATMKGDSMETYEQYRDRVADSCSEAMQKGFFPVWGTGARDGRILARHYKVNLTIYEVGCVEEDGREKLYAGINDISKEQPYSRTVEIAFYPGHFMPVQNKTE